MDVRAILPKNSTVGDLGGETRAQDDGVFELGYLDITLFLRSFAATKQSQVVQVSAFVSHQNRNLQPPFAYSKSVVYIPINQVFYLPPIDLARCSRHGSCGTLPIFHTAIATDLPTRMTSWRFSAHGISCVRH